MTITNVPVPPIRQVSTAGVYRPLDGTLYLRFTNTSGYADVAIPYGMPGDYPVTGDWDGDGVDTIGIYRGGAFFLRNSNTAGYAEVTLSFGQSGDLPVAGDWDGDGKATVGVFRGGSSCCATASRRGHPTGPSASASRATCPSPATGTATASTQSGCTGRRRQRFS